MANLNFNKVHKNGWISYRQVGTTGAVFIDRRMLTPEAVENPPATLEEALACIVPPGADASAKAAEKTAKQMEREAAKAAKAAGAIEKANARLAKLQAAADAARARAEAAAAKVQ